MLASWKNEPGNTWLKIRVPMRPNGRTGWVRESALGTLHTVHTQLVVNRHTLRVTLYVRGHKRFSARIGVGKASTPTPAGHFWIREKFHVAGTTIYGPPRSARARTRRRCPTGPAEEWSACTEPTSPVSSPGARRTAASACATATSSRSTDSPPRAPRSTSV